MGHKLRELPLDSNRLLLTQREAADAIGVGMTTIYLLMKENKLAARRIGRRVMIEASELRRFIRDMPAR